MGRALRQLPTNMHDSVAWLFFPFIGWIMYALYDLQVARKLQVAAANSNWAAAQTALKGQGLSARQMVYLYQEAKQGAGAPSRASSTAQSR